MSESGWKLISVVVQVPCKGNYTEKDFRWAVDRALKSSSLEKMIRAHGETSFGAVLVKQMSKVEAARKTLTKA